MAACSAWRSPEPRGQKLPMAPPLGWFHSGVPPIRHLLWTPLPGKFHNATHTVNHHCAPSSEVWIATQVEVNSYYTLSVQTLASHPYPHWSITDQELLLGVGPRARPTKMRLGGDSGHCSVLECVPGLLASMKCATSPLLWVMVSQ